MLENGFSDFIIPMLPFKVKRNVSSENNISMINTVIKYLSEKGNFQRGTKN